MTVPSWNEISTNPNSSEVLSFRAKKLKESRQLCLIKNRVEYITHCANGLKVLDIGVIEHFSESSSVNTWLHQHVAKSARSCLGIDILEKEVDQLRQRGYNVLLHDIIQSPLNEKFELIIVGDVVEHLNNPGALFQNAAAMLERGGRLLISTPNPFYANVILKNVFEGEPFTDSADHVAWFDAGTLYELAYRNGLILKRYFGVKSDPSASIRSFLFFKMASLLIKIGIRPEVFAKTMIYEFATIADLRE